MELRRSQERFQHDLLANRRARDYLIDRGLGTSALIWGLGYCAGGDHLLRHRITFPIHDWQGRLVSFAGRTLTNRGAKYLTLPDGIHFEKHKTLYGLNRAIPHIAESRVAIVVEGYTDVMGCHDLVGLRNVVGCMGVALTTPQLNLLSRWARIVAVVLDGDAAGQRAAARLARKHADSPAKIIYVTMPKGKDPFDLAREDPEELLRRLRWKLALTM